MERKFRENREIFVTVNTLGSTIGDVTTTSTATVLFRLMNAISVTQVGIQKGSKNLNKPG